MTSERWQRIKEIVGDALAMPLADRAAFLTRACAGDVDMLAEASSLLAAEDPTGAFLDIDRPPDRIGVYRIVREIGRGGMGTVYLGERADGQFEQQVAVKVVKRGMDSAAVLRRFAAERQILARLQHPNIARLLDGGMTPDGRPYFVMEYLEAEPITEYCRRTSLGISERLDLMRLVCDAVDYAHRHLVLHRDLKAENILVDASGAPKLLDFGIAKVLATGDEAMTATEIGQRALTPQTSSPEQIRGEPLTTASDVYALGLLLYELLTGRAPYEVPASTPVEQMRVISEVRPKRPSEVALPGEAGWIRGDLDTVVLKALEKDPALRYTSAADLAEDLRRIREDRPILARRAHAAYRARKYAARHWRALTAAAAVAIVLAWSVGDALVQGRRAERHFQDLRKLANSFVFEFHDAIAKLPGATPARELVVSRALQYLDGLSREAAGDVELKRELAESYLRVGDVQGLYYESNLGKTADARVSYDNARALFAEVVRARPDDAKAAVALETAKLRFASTFQATDPARARALLDEVLEDLPASAVPGDAEPRRQLTRAMAYVGIAENRQTPSADAASARNQAIDLFTPLAATHPEMPEGRRFLSMSLKRRAATQVTPPGQLANARDDLARAAALDEQRVAADPSDSVAKLDLALGQSYLSGVLRRSGDLDAAVTAIARAMEAREAVLAADPQNLRVRTQLIGDCGKLAAMSAERHDPAAAKAAVQKGEALAAVVSGPPAQNPDFQAALAEFKKVTAGVSANHRTP